MPEGRLQDILTTGTSSGAIAALMVLGIAKRNSTQSDYLRVMALGSGIGVTTALGYYLIIKEINNAQN